MSKRSTIAAASLVLAMTVFSAPANASLLFAEDFENDLSAWTGKNDGAHNGIIVDKPFDTGHAMKFSATNSSGDIFTRDMFSSPGGTFVLGYDYLGTCEQDDCGGFAGYSFDLPGIHGWISGTSTASGAVDGNDDMGSWMHVSIKFTTMALAPIHLIFEDYWTSTDHYAGNAYFDNITLHSVAAAVPEPAPLSFLLFGLMGVGFIHWQRKHKAGFLDSK